MSAIPPPPAEQPAAPAVIDAAFFDNILETDLANVIKKATRGLPLSAREREMIEAERARLKKASAPPEFELEVTGPESALEQMTQKELAVEWGVSLRTIKGWSAEGLAAKDPVPLTKPDQFPGWFARVHAPRQCPEKYRLAAQRILLGGKATPATTPAPSTPPPRERTVISEESKGLLAMLERHREAEARLGTEYMKAVDQGDEVRSSFLLGQWSNMGEKLRALEKAAPKALEEMGIYVRKDDVMRELEPLHRSIPKSFRQRFRLARVKLLTLAQAGPEEWNREIDKIVEDVCRGLVDSDFREPLELEVA